MEGPLQGHHREWYLVRPSAEMGVEGRLKVGQPREGVLLFDRRCFPSEETVLAELQGRGVPRVTPLHRVGLDGPSMHGYIEGRTLAEVAPPGSDVPPELLAQIMEVFHGLVRVRPESLTHPPRPGCEDLYGPRDSAGFLAGLVRYTYELTGRPGMSRYASLFRQLGVSRRTLAPASRLACTAQWLADRPFRLLHGDLHRANFIVDPAGRLWTIDWELAAVGDPLYDLATHLYLMDYSPEQRQDVIAGWREAVRDESPEASTYPEWDLDRYLEYKCVQSVFTDVVRQAVAVREAGTEHTEERLAHAAKTVSRVLQRARDVLPLKDVPAEGAVEAAYRGWLTDQGGSS